MCKSNRCQQTFILLLLLGMGPLNAQPPSATKGAIHLSPELTELLRAEMREIVPGVQSLSVGIATANWKSVAETSAQIEASYLLEQRLTPEQKKELSTSLPEHFKRLDAGFHREAKKLKAAALQHDAQLSAFHFYRMLETCTACHAAYATSKFPGFSSSGPQPHEH